MDPRSTEKLASMKLSSPLARDVKTERIKFLYAGAITAIGVNIMIALIFLVLLWERVDQSLLLIWFSALLFVTFLRAVNLYFYRKAETVYDNTKLWFSLFFVLSTVSGIIWGTSIWYLAPSDDLVTPILIVFTIGGLTAGAAAVLGSFLSVYFTYIFVTMLPSTIWFLQSGDETYRLMGGMLCIYIIAMMAAGYIYRRIVLYSIIVSEELIEAKNIAESANRAKTDFLASMSHEIRTPLNAVIGFSQILKADKKTPLDARQESSVDLVLEAGRHLLELVSQVMDLAKIESNATSLKFVAVSYNELLNECIPLIQLSASKVQVSIDNDQDASNDYILWTDKLRLKQVIINLLDNAIKYNIQGGSVSLTHEKHASHFLRITISDTGQGIEKDKQKRLFKAFDRLGYENSQIEGTGIGLLMSKRIIEQMRGRIGFKSVQGQGSQFWIDVPLAKEESYS